MLAQNAYCSSWKLPVFACENTDITRENEREREKAAANAGVRVLAKVKLLKRKSEQRVESADVREPESKLQQSERKAR